MERRDRYRRVQSRRDSTFRDKAPRKKKQFIKKARLTIILDVLPRGHPEEDKPSWTKTPLAQVLTLPDFVLYEVKTDKHTDLKPEEKDIYENFIKFNKLGDVLKKIDFKDLTNAAKALLQPILEREILNYEVEFINFFNNSASITPRMHSLKLLPSIGNKHMWEIINERAKQNFTSFQDIIDRTSVSNPVKIIAQRIIIELEREEKYYIFSKTQKYE